MKQVASIVAAINVSRLRADLGLEYLLAITSPVR